MVEPVDLIQDLHEQRGFPGSGMSDKAQHGKVDLHASDTFTFMLLFTRIAPALCADKSDGYETPTEAQAEEPGTYPGLNPAQHRVPQPLQRLPKEPLQGNHHTAA